MDMSMQMQQEPEKHSPLPWELRPEVGRYPYLIRSTEGVTVAAVYLDAPSVMEYEEMQANAAFLIRAVNNHDALIAALTDCAKRMDKLRELMAVSGGRESEIKILDTADAWAALSGAQSQS